MKTEKTIAALNEKMSEYVKMETEIPFAEFTEFYQDLTGLLQTKYQEFSIEELILAKGMTMIVAGNARVRSSRKDENRKKFMKMAEKAKFWEDAIALRLKKDGISEDELEEKVSALWE